MILGDLQFGKGSFSSAVGWPQYQTNSQSHSQSALKGYYVPLLV